MCVRKRMDSGSRREAMASTICCMPSCKEVNSGGGGCLRMAIIFLCAASMARLRLPYFSSISTKRGSTARALSQFDYCCCHASFALQEMGVESIMVNCNPETVSTDYDTSDRLYFEPLTLEHVLN